MLENTYSEEKKLFLFQDWLGCNQDSLDELWLDSDFMTGFRRKLFFEAVGELKNRRNNIGLQKNKKEIEGVIDGFLYIDVLRAMKKRHLKENYKFDAVNAVYAIIHQWTGFDKFRNYFRQVYLGLEIEEQKIVDWESVEIYETKTTEYGNTNILQEKFSISKNKQIRKFLEILLQEFKSFLESKKRKNSFDLTHFLDEICNAVEGIGIKIRYIQGKDADGNDREIIEDIEIAPDDTGLAIFQFLNQSDGLNQDKIKTYIENQSSYKNNYEHSLKKIRNFWKEFEYDKSNLTESVEIYQQVLREFSNLTIKHHYKISDNQKDY